MFLGNKIKSREFLKLLPILIPFTLFFIYGLIFTFLQSIGIGTPIENSFKGFETYSYLLRDEWFKKSWVFSFKIAFLSSLLSLLLGTILSYFIWNIPIKDRNGLIVYKIPLILPHIVAAFFIQIYFSRSGILSSLLYNLHIIKDITSFPNIVYSNKGFGIVLAYIYKEVPFVILLQLAVYNRIDKNIILTAYNLGSSKIRTYFCVILQYLIPVLDTTFIILFLYSFGAYEIPFILGSGRPDMVAIYIYNLYFNYGLEFRSLAMASLIMLFMFSILFVVIYTKLISKVRFKVGYL